MKMRHRLLGLVAAAAALCGMAAPAAAAEYKSEYRLSIVLAPPTPWGQTAKIWADLVKERTQGRINIKLTRASRSFKVTRHASSARCARA